MGRTKFSTSTALALAALLLSSSTAVYAVASLPKHSVGKKQLKTSAVTTKKIHKGAVTASKIAPGTVVSAQRMAFGKGNATSATPTTVLSLPRVHITVTTDGDTDTNPQVEVNLPPTTGSTWYINSSDQAMFSTNGGRHELSAAGTSREFTAHIWRIDSTPAIFLHCVFDTDGFTTSRPLSCWAFSS